jgi:hypothetical protein
MEIYNSKECLIVIVIVMMSHEGVYLIACS